MPAKKSATKKRATRKPTKPVAAKTKADKVDALIESGKLAQAIDLTYELQTARREEQRKVDALAKDERACLAACEEALKSEELRTAGGKVGRIDLKEETVFTVEDWGSFLKFAARKGNNDLVQQRVGTTAARARYEDGVTIPGIEPVRKLRPVLGKAK